ncbi:MAG: AMP-binding protein [Rhizobiales bacterium]|nr:AMP-binding protein [Hyphomicrobiales bacterium]
MDGTSCRPASLFERLCNHSNKAPNAPAILAQASPVLTYQQLFGTAEKTMSALRHMGIHHRNRIAVVLPAGPEMCVAVIALAAGAVCIPLNPGLADDDWPGYFKELRVDALVTILRTNSAAERAATSLGLQIIELVPLPHVGAGAFELVGPASKKPAGNELSQLADDAFVLPTSGTTSQPKVVPLTHLNICHSAINTANALGLSSNDRLLSVLPLYHAHGLISGLMSSLAAGASIVCMRQFDATEFFRYLDEFQPTWYTAVPAIHQAILAEAHEHKHVLKGHSLRLIRSASASLPVQRFNELEHLFEVPVIETYGMTEAASQIASNPLPPMQQKPGSVGRSAGPEITILNSNGEHCPPGGEGEIALRGPNLARGYDNPSVTGKDLLTDGWFRTGDLGYLDADGYLYIVGRTKELINRGGEKIAPGKIEEVVLGHPAVAEAIAFSIPHPRLGEDVAAAVVLKPQANATVQNLRSFALDSNKLTHAEIPRHIVFVDTIPKSTTGKIQRNNMAQTLELTDVAAATDARQSNYAAPATHTEQRLAAIWAEVFGLEQVGVRDDFFLLGGDSLLAIQIAIRVSDEFDVSLSLRALFEAPTVSELAKQIADSRRSIEQDFSFETLQSDSKPEKAVSIAQECILNLENKLKGFPIFSIPFVFRMVGDFDPPAFERAVKALAYRNEIFRRTFRSANDHWKSIPSAAISSKIAVEDWKLVPPADKMGFAEERAADEAWNMFHLTKAPPLRMRLLKFADDDHVLILTIHHIIMDAWTMKILMEELFRHYGDALRGKRSIPVKPQFQFSDFARWQRQWCQGETARRQLDYWRTKLSNAVSVFAKKPDLAKAGASFGTQRAPVHFDNELIGRLADFARGENSTVFMALLTGLKQLLLSKFAQGDICVATPMANRSRPQTDGLMGLIENTTVIRTVVNEDMTFRQALQAVRESVLDAHAHQELPFEVLVSKLAEMDGLDTGPLTDVYFSVVSHSEPDIDLQHLDVYRVENIHEQNQLMLPINSSNFMFLLKETHDGVVGWCLYKDSQFDPQTVKTLVCDLNRLLELAVSKPDRKLIGLILNRP